MCDLLLKNGYPVDYIIFNDTLDEYNEMYEYLVKVDEHFKNRYGIGITKTKPKKTYREHIFHRKTKGEHVGEMIGLPNAVNGFCEWRGISKRDAFNLFAKDFDKHKTYIGITRDEQHRANREDESLLYPLIDYFQMGEEDCKAYLINQEMENPLYRHFSRTGCAKCQFKSDRDWYNTWKHYPKVWAELAELEEEVSKHDNVFSKNIFTNYRTCADMEEQFKKADQQGSLFDFSDEPLKDCFCKI